MKILHVLHDDLPSLESATARHVHELALAQERRGHALACLHRARADSRGDTELVEGVLDGLRTLARVANTDADATPWSDPRAEHDFARALELERPAVVHVHQLAGWGPRVVALARASGARVLVTLHDQHALCARGTLARNTPGGGVERCAGSGAQCTDCLAPFARAGARLAELHAERRAAFRAGLAEAHVVVAPSRSVLRTFAGAGFLAGAVVEILPAGTSGVLHKPRTRHVGRLRLGFLGGPGPEHGLRVLLDALALAPRAPFELHVHGTDTWPDAALAELRARARAVALQFPVQFHGRIPPRHVDAAYAGFDVLVVPSLAPETGPAQIHDAFRCGLTVVASDVGGCADFVRDGIDGLLVPPGDARALVRACEHLLADPALYDRLCRDRPKLATITDLAQRLDGLYAPVPSTPRAQAHGGHAS